MMNKRSGRNNAALTLFMIAGSALASGCAAADAAELETFVRDLLLSATAALLL